MLFINCHIYNNYYFMNYDSILSFNKGTDMKQEELQNRSDYKQANENVNQTNRPDLNTLESQKKVAQNEVSGKSRIDRFKENYNETVQGKGAKIARTATNVTNKGIASATGGESNEINETKGINTAKEKKGEDK